MKDSYKEIDEISHIAPGPAQDRAINDFLEKRTKVFRSFGIQLCRRHGAEQAGLEDDVTQEVRLEAFKMIREQLEGSAKITRKRVWELELRYRCTNGARSTIDSATATASGTSSLARRRRNLKVTEEIMINENGAVPTDKELVARHNERMEASRANATKQGMKATTEDLKVTASVDVDSMRSLSIEAPRDCVLHPAESETFQRSVVAHCKAESETLGKVAAIWMELISQGVQQPEIVAEIVSRTELSAAQVRRRIHNIRALSVEMLENQHGITPADV